MEAELAGVTAELAESKATAKVGRCSLKPADPLRVESALAS